MPQPTEVKSVPDAPQLPQQGVNVVRQNNVELQQLERRSSKELLADDLARKKTEAERERKRQLFRKLSFAGIALSTGTQLYRDDSIGNSPQ